MPLISIYHPSTINYVRTLSRRPFFSRPASRSQSPSPGGIRQTYFDPTYMKIQDEGVGEESFSVMHLVAHFDKAMRGMGIKL